MSRCRVGLAPAFAAVVFALGACVAPGSVRPVVKVGLVASFEGAHRAEGYEALYAVRLAILDQNRRGGVAGRLVELVALDDTGVPGRAAGQPAELSVDPNVLGAVGHVQWWATDAALSEYARLGLPVVVISGWRVGSPDAPAVYLQPDLVEQLRALLSMGGLGGGKIAVVSSQGALPLSLGGLAEASRVDPSAQDWLESLRRSDAATVVLDGSAEEAAEWSRQMAGAGLSPILIGSAELGSPVFTQWAAEGSEVWVTSLAPAVDVSSWQDFCGRYREIAGSEPGLIAPVAYDGMRVLLQALDAAGKAGRMSRAGVATKLKAVRFDGVTGPVAFDRDGHRIGAGLAVWRVSGEGRSRVR